MLTFCGKTSLLYLLHNSVQKGLRNSVGVYVRETPREQRAAVGRTSKPSVESDI